MFDVPSPIPQSAIRNPQSAMSRISDNRPRPLSDSPFHRPYPATLLTKRRQIREQFLLHWVQVVV